MCDKNRVMGDMPALPGCLQPSITSPGIEVIEKYKKDKKKYILSICLEKMHPGSEITGCRHRAAGYCIPKWGFNLAYGYFGR